MPQPSGFSNSYVQYGIRIWAIIRIEFKSMQYGKEPVIQLFRDFKCHIRNNGIVTPQFGKDVFSTMKI